MKHGTKDSIELICHPRSLSSALRGRYRSWRFARLITKLYKYFPPGDNLRIAVDPATKNIVGVRLGMVPEDSKVSEVPEVQHGLSELVEHPDETDE